MKGKHFFEMKKKKKKSVGMTIAQKKVSKQR